MDLKLKYPKTYEACCIVMLPAEKSFRDLADESKWLILAAYLEECDDFHKKFLFVNQMFINLLRGRETIADLCNELVSIHFSMLEEIYSDADYEVNKMFYERERFFESNFRRSM